ncbi:hypothetical protein E3N88_07160 [Mikania micrantha]|uniref:Uncharacterized protein n=1 Tax=Mikania micrantha TaxID=192012 RepID=A0A5N6PQR2_9ASTR|nr:hypothetical protein E3N88_07160 [Mikania micrantha]
MRTQKDARRLPAGFVDDTSKINARDLTFFFSRRKPVEEDEPGSELNGAELPETTPDTRQEMNVGMISEDKPTKRDLTDTSNESDSDFVRIPRRKKRKVLVQEKIGTKKPKNRVEKDDMQRKECKDI